MNFYIGTNIDEIDINQYNIEIYDEIFEQIIKAVMICIFLVK